MGKKYTVIILHYNQEQYIYEALDSVLNQTYENIELIISDDASNSFNKSKIEKHIKTKRPQIKLEFVINQKNLGTVKTLNKCLKLSKGDYIQIFAADDRLNNKNVISNFEKEFNKNLDRNIIAAQCIMCDSDIDVKNYEYTDIERATELNELKTLFQYKELAIKCIYAAGAVAYRKEVFENYGYPDENYKLIEDLTFWLSLNLKNEKIYFSNFLALDHRDGGVSKEQTPNQSVIFYYYDLALMYEKQILPFLCFFNKKEKVKIKNSYLNIVRFLRCNVKGYNKTKRRDMIITYLKYPSIFYIKIKNIIKNIFSKKIKIKDILSKGQKKIFFKKDNILLKLSNVLLKKVRETFTKIKNLIKRIVKLIILEKRKIIFYFFWILLNVITVNVFYQKTLLLPFVLILVNNFVAKILTYILYFIVRRLKNGK